jgi:hypothetical protein
MDFIITSTSVAAAVAVVSAVTRGLLLIGHRRRILFLVAVESIKQGLVFESVVVYHVMKVTRSDHG